MILLVGAGPMAQDYAKVLQGLDQQYCVVGRSEKSASEFQKATGHMAIAGGLTAYLSICDQPIEAAIVSVGVENLATATRELVAYGVKQILVEKPAGLDAVEISGVADDAKAQEAKVYVAYNRRFFSSVIAAKNIIEEDGGVESFNFELTEWSHVIGALTKGEGVLENWFLANTSHVADMAFYLGGKPEQLSCFISGSTDWHSRSANFAGAGKTASGVLFNYNGNWNAPGRWSVEVLTRYHRLIFRPMEQLHIQPIGSIKQKKMEVDDRFDCEFKPGLFKQVQSFINGDSAFLCSIDEQLAMSKVYQKMAGYRD